MKERGVGGEDGPGMLLQGYILNRVKARRKDWPRATPGQPHLASVLLG